MARRRLLPLFLSSALLGLALPHASAAAPGHLQGVIRDEAGEPVTNLLIALLHQSAEVLPLLARTDDQGRIRFQDIAAGLYELRIKNSRYRGPEESITVLPGRTTVVTLILQQLLNFSPSQEDNLSIKTLMRTVEDERRLIFRHLPQPEAENAELWKPPFQSAVFQLYGSGGLDSDYLVFPGDSARGAVTNFAMVQSVGESSRYVLAGQLNSGEDSVWRLKSFFEHPLSHTHAIGLSVGYARMSFDQPSLALLNNPAMLSDSPDFTRASATTKMISLGFDEQWHLSEALSLLWGVEMNHLEGARSRTFLNPSAEIAYTPLDKIRVRFLMASKRLTQRGSLMLPSGDVVSLNDAVYLSQVGDQISFATARHFVGSLTQRLDEATELEVAAYGNQFDGQSTPFVALLPEDTLQVFHLNGDQADGQGYRLTVRRQLSENLSTSVSYVLGRASGIRPESDLASFEAGKVSDLIQRNQYRAFSTQIDAFVPFSRTHLNALVNFVPGQGHPVPTLDVFSDAYDVGNEGVNLFVRQMVPVPGEWLNLVGLDFLSAYQIEALLDIRNLTNEELAQIHTAEGDVLLVRNPRTVRGGIAVRF